jgi:WD40 repeat protein
MSAIVGALVCVTVTARAWSGQQQDRRGRNEPGLIVETGARMGTCDVLTFTADGRYLLAAGDDKVVRIWPVTTAGLDLANVRSLRWSIWHERRGNIYALALDKKETRVAIAGKGILTGMVEVLDLATGDVVQALTQVKDNDQVIRALAFSPSGGRLAIGTEDGSVWIWDLSSGNANDVNRLNKASGTVNQVRLLVFEDENQLVSVTRDGHVRAWNAGRPGLAPVERFRFLDALEAPDLYRVAVSADGRWLAAAGLDARVQIRSIDGRERRADLVLSTSRQPPTRLPGALAFDATGNKLAVGIYVVPRANNFFKGTEDEVVIYDLRERPPRPIAGPPCTFHAEALAFHPDGNRLALGGGNNHETILWDSVARKQIGPTARGPGSCLWGVGLSSNSRYLGFQEQRATDPDVNRRGQGPWRVFDLEKRKFVNQSEGFKPVPAREQAGGWKVYFTEKDVFKWSAVAPDGTAFPLLLEEHEGGIPLCYTFLEATRDQPVRLAVGQYYGTITIFELGDGRPRHVVAAADGARQMAAPARTYVGHQGEIMAMAPSADQQWLVTASRDQTVAAWNLGDWPSHTELGARFRTNKDKVLVASVDTGSPAWEAGLLEGDEIRLLAVNRHLVFNRTADNGRPVGDPGACLEYVHHPKPGKEMVFYLRRAGQRDLIHTNTTVSRRPQWCFFPARDREWVLWLWRSYYYDTSTNGDFLVGWHVNKGKMLEQKPDFYKAEKMRKLFQREDLVDVLLWEPRVEGTLRTIVGFRPPQVTLTQRAGGEELEVTMHARAFDKDNPDQQLQRVELWIDDFRLGVWNAAGSQFDKTIRIPRSSLRSGVNQLTLQCFNKAGGNDEDKKTVRHEMRKELPDLHGLVIGIDDYSKARVPGGAPENLKYTKEDAREMRQAWLKQVGKRYRQGDVQLLLDKEASRGAILGNLRRLVDKAKPDDLLVLFMGGHGYDQSRGRRQPGTESFVFCCPTFDIDDPDNTGITSQQLYEELARLHCRKLVLLDVCHSGLVVNPIRGLAPGGKGPTILASCDKTEAAIEDDKFKHGLFTYAVVEALSTAFDEADLDKDGKLDAAELFSYAEMRLPKLLTELMRSEGQNPTRFPRNPDPAPLAEK